MSIHNQLMRITANMPMKQIELEGKPYLRRYYAGSVNAGGDIWLHHFLSADGDRHVHNHPFDARSVILNGWYRETGEINGRSFDWERTADYRAPTIVKRLTAFAEDANAEIYGEIVKADWEHIGPMTWHRITEVGSDTWTLMLVKPGRRIPFWFFMDDNGQYVPNESSPADWWKHYGTRAEREQRG